MSWHYDHSNGEDTSDESCKEAFIIVNNTAEDSSELPVADEKYIANMVNNLPHVFNLSNSIIGITILAMPFCFKECGIILGAILLVFCTWLTLVSCRLLMKAGITSRRRSYGFLAYYTYGAPGKLAVEIGMIGLQIGTLIAQVVIIGDLGPNIISKYTGLQNTHGLRTAIITVLSLCVGLPLCLLKNLHSLSRASTMCVLFYACFVFYVFIMSLPNLVEGSWINRVKLWRVDGMLKCLPIFSFAFGCQTQLFILYDVLAEPSFKGINSIVKSAVNLCTVAYLLVGFFGYVTFCDKDIGGDVITEYDASLLSDILQLGFVTTIAVTFPLIIYPCRVSLYTLLFSQKQKHAEDLEQRPVLPEFHFKVLTAAIVLFAMITGILVPNVEFVLQMNGATMGTLICYIFPAVFFLRVMTGSSDGKNRAQAVFVFGFLIMVLCTYTALSINDQSHKPVEVIVQEKRVPAAAAVGGMKEKPLQPPGDVQNPPKHVDSVKDKPPDSHQDGMKSNDKADGDKRIEPPYPREPAEGNDKNLKNAEGKGDVADKKLGTAGGDTPLQKAADGQVDKSSDRAVRNVDVKPVQGSQDKKTADVAKENSVENVKQKELIAQLEKQQQEQKELIKKQKEILEELKEHKLEHKQNDVKQKVADQQQAVADQERRVQQQEVAGQQIGGQKQVGAGQQIGGQLIGGQLPADAGQKIGGQQPAGAGQEIGGQQQVVVGQQIGGQKQVSAGQQVAGQQQAGAGQQIGGQQQAVVGQQIGGQKQEGAGQQVVGQQQAGAGQQIGGQQQAVAGQQFGGQQQAGAGQQIGGQQQAGAGQQLGDKQQASLRQQINSKQNSNDGNQVYVQQGIENRQLVHDKKPVMEVDLLNQQKVKTGINSHQNKDFLKAADGIKRDSVGDGQNTVLKQKPDEDKAQNVQGNVQRPVDSLKSADTLVREMSKGKTVDKEEIRRRRDTSDSKIKTVQVNNSVIREQLVTKGNKQKFNEEMKRKKLLSIDSKNLDVNDVLEQIDKNSLFVDSLSQIRSLKSVKKDSP